MIEDKHPEYLGRSYPGPRGFLELSLWEDRGTKKKNDSKVQQASVLIHIILQFLNMVTNYLL